MYLFAVFTDIFIFTLLNFAGVKKVGRERVREIRDPKCLQVSPLYRSRVAMHTWTRREKSEKPPQYFHEKHHLS